MSQTKQNGFILVLTLMILSIGVLLVTQLFHRGTGHLYFDEAMLSRQKAQTLALSSIELVKSQLSLVMNKTPGKKEDRKQLLQQILPYINRWQTLELKENNDGIDAQIQLMVSCEDGKLNINQLFDFSKKQFKSQDIRGVIRTLFASLKKFMQDKDLFPAFEKFLKERKYPLDDISEVLMIEEFKKGFGQKVFYPPMQQKEVGETKQVSVYLFDIFTVWTDHDTVSAWVISDSLAALLGLRRAYVGEMVERTKLSQDITKKVDVDQKTLFSVWDALLKKWYAKDYKALPKGIGKLLEATFDPTIFSVVCYAKVGSITQKLYAIIEREFDEKKRYAEFSVKKVYWI